MVLPLDMETCWLILILFFEKSVNIYMKVVDIADEIYRELSFPSDLSIPVIAFWVRTNIGALNNLINTSYSINEATLEILQPPPGSDLITEEISENEKAIMKKMYFVHYYERRIRENLGVGAIDQTVEVSSDGMSVRKVSKTEIIRYVSSLKKQEFEELEKLVHSYKINKAVPRQVTGDDTVEGRYVGDWSRTLGL